VGVAVKVTLVPEQIVLSASLEAMLTLTALLLTVVDVDEVDVVAAQPEALV
jgi:hypothetical protein